MEPTTPPRDSQKPFTGEFPVGPGVPAPPPRGLERLAIPRPRALLTGILLVRFALVSLVVGRSLGDGSSGPDAAFASILALAAFAVIASIWLVLALTRRKALPGPDGLLLQATVDVLAVTSLVAFSTNSSDSGTEATSIAALYVALVTVYALLLPVGRGLLAVAFATVCYIGVTLIAPTQPGLATDAAFWLQVGLIAFVGGLIAVLGNRLASVASAQQVLAAALQQARLEAEEILATIQSGVITIDGDGRLAYLNPRGRRILGDDAAFVQGAPVLDTLRAHSPELHQAILRGISEGGRVARGEASVRRRDGSLFPVGLSTTTFQRPGGGQRLVTAIFTDISDLKRMQEFRMRAERLEGVAALSASLAHEIRNPLMAIRSAVEQLSRSVGEDEDDQTLARLIMRESERLNRLLTEFLDFSRVRAVRFEKLDLREVVEDVVRIVSAHPAAEGVELVIEGESVELEGDADLLHRIVSNLVLNAAQALNGQGTVRVSVRREVGGGAPSLVEREVRLLVSDNGPGIPDSVRERLFEPFVSGRQGGTGLGLAIVQRAVAAHRGVILMDTSAEMGTTFSIYLPSTWNREDGA